MADERERLIAASQEPCSYCGAGQWSSEKDGRRSFVCGTRILANGTTRRSWACRQLSDLLHKLKQAQARIDELEYEVRQLRGILRAHQIIPVEHTGGDIHER